jgi:hypothetical protein
MASVSTPPPVRHGTTRLLLLINGRSYVLKRMPPPPGFFETWVLRRSEPDASGARPAYCVAAHLEDPEPGCTCPDHRRTGAPCKHILALRAHGLIPPAAGVAPLVPPPAAPSFAAGFQQAVAAHIGRNGKPAAPPAPSPVVIQSPARARRAHAPRAREAITESLPEGWQPGGMAPAHRSEAEHLASLPVGQPAAIGRRAADVARREDARHHARRPRAKAPVATS